MHTHACAHTHTHTQKTLQERKRRFTLSQYSLYIAPRAITALSQSTGLSTALLTTVLINTQVAPLLLGNWLSLTAEESVQLVNIMIAFCEKQNKEQLHFVNNLQLLCQLLKLKKKVKYI